MLQVLDYSQYYLDLKKANREGRAEWQLGYNLSTYYNYPTNFMREVSARSFHHLAEAFISPDLGGTLFKK